MYGNFNLYNFIIVELSEHETLFYSLALYIVQLIKHFSDISYSDIVLVGAKNASLGKYTILSRPANSSSGWFCNHRGRIQILCCSQ